MIFDARKQLLDIDECGSRIIGVLHMFTIVRDSGLSKTSSFDPDWLRDVAVHPGAEKLLGITCRRVRSHSAAGGCRYWRRVRTVRRFGGQPSGHSLATSVS